MNGPSRLRKWREARGLTQEEAAKRVGAQQSSWCDWENAEKSPSVRFALRIARTTRGAVPVSSWSDDPSSVEAA